LDSRGALVERRAGLYVALHNRLRGDELLANRTALITGSTSGIGLGIARALAQAGANIVLSGFGEPAAIEKIRAGIAGEFGVEAIYAPADMRRPDEIADMVAAAQRRLGGVDILVNNAGIQHVAPVEAFPTDKWDAIIAVNLSAAFHAMRAALPAMKARRWGRVINIASAHGLVASAEKAAYVAAKHGLVGLTKVAAIECANDGITCNAICPGWVLTPLVEQQIAARAQAAGQPIEEAKRALLAEKQPMHAFTTTDSIGALAVFLCGEAAATITGAAYSIDGGWTAQ
jgi:3-hydroxybutyrate dehydrogenase